MLMTAGDAGLDKTAGDRCPEDKPAPADPPIDRRLGAGFD